MPATLGLEIQDQNGSILRMQSKLYVERHGYEVLSVDITTLIYPVSGRQRSATETPELNTQSARTVCRTLPIPHVRA